MSSFASLMALSATHTRENQVAVQHALQERQRKEAAQRKQQQEREARERELEKKVRMKMLEEEKRQKEKLERMEAQRMAMEAARERKEEEQRNAFLYGPKKAKTAMAGGGSPKYPQSTAAKEAAKSRLGDDSDGDGSGGLALTREELRQRKREAELRKQFTQGSSKKNSSGGPRKDGHRLPGGAVNIVVNAKGDSATPIAALSDPSSGKTLKERLTQGPNTLMLLQTKARDRRTVDEAQQDIRIKLGKATPKVLSGEEARSFDDWFGSSKDKEKNPKEPPLSRSTSSTPGPIASSNLGPALTLTPVTSTSLSSSHKNAVSSISRPSSTKPTAASASRPSVPPKVTPTGKDSIFSQGTKSQKSSKSSTPISSTPHCPPSSITSRDTVAKQKRRRSPVRSESPPPKRHREDYFGSSIWKMITGRDRDTFADRDIDSDDDMEADAFALEREEHVSSRIALKEDMQALDEERRREEEKRRRKKEKQRALSRY